MNPFEFKTRNLELAFGFTRATISAIRNKLKQRGLIEFGKGVGSGSAVYLICGAEITNQELAKRICVQSKNTILNTTLNTTLNTNDTQTQNTPCIIEDNKTKDKRHKKTTKKSDVVEDVVSGQIALDFGVEEKPKKKKGPPAHESPSPPSRDEVLEYFRANAADRLKDWETSANLFYDSYNATGWIDNNGRYVRNWDSAANKWIFYREDQEKKGILNEDRQTDKFSERRGAEPANPKRKGFKGTF